MMGFSRRGLALGALAAFMVALGPASATFARGAQPAVATLSASPDTDLVDGQAITVTAAGYTPHHTLDLVQCVEAEGCDFSNLQLNDSGDTGGFTTTLLVRRVLTIGTGVQVDCAAAENCILVSIDITDLSAASQTSINFDPNAPLPPPLHFRIAPDPTGHVRVNKGVARITGTVRCNQPVDIGADTVLVQVCHRQIFRSEAFVTISCSRDGRFAVVFRPQNGLFGEGTATLHIDAFGSTSTSYELFKHVTLTLVQST
jgi:hypothetical protein